MPTVPIISGTDRVERVARFLARLWSAVIEHLDEPEAVGVGDGWLPDGPLRREMVPTQRGAPR
jgi:hypothetical protein